MHILTEWITGCMVGVEYSDFPLEGYEEDVGAEYEGSALILDLAIFRLIFIW